MLGQENEHLKKELDELLAALFADAQGQYIAVRDAYRNAYDWPELESLRQEICLCITLGLSQAAIALTNFLLETLLKYSLIYFDRASIESEDSLKKFNSLSIIDWVSPNIDKYAGADLADNINRACTMGLISKETKEELHTLRETYRNAFSHSDMKKMFGSGKVGVIGVHIDEKGPSIYEQKEVSEAYMLPIHSLIRPLQARKEAPRYFSYVDSLVRNLKKRVFPGGSDA